MQMEQHNLQHELAIARENLTNNTESMQKYEVLQSDFIESIEKLEEFLGNLNINQTSLKKKVDKILESNEKVESSSSQLQENYENLTKRIQYLENIFGGNNRTNLTDFGILSVSIFSLAEKLNMLNVSYKQLENKYFDFELNITMIQETLHYSEHFQGEIIDLHNRMNKTLSSLERSHINNITKLKIAQNELNLIYLELSNTTLTLNHNISQKYLKVLSMLRNLSEIVNDNINDSEKQIQNLKINNSFPATTVIETGGKAHHTCLELLNNGYNQSGVYNITPIPGYTETVYCDQKTDGGGWMIIMRNRYGNITFDQTWNEYKNGFGHLRYDFWLGNDFLYRMTTLYNVLRGKTMDLYVKLIEHANETFYAKYNKFVVDSEENKYFLIVDGYSGTAGNSLSYSNQEYFTTKDRDNDKNPDNNCANISEKVPVTVGGWWYFNCYESCLTKTFSEYDTVHKTYLPAPQWFKLRNNYNHLKGAEMMLREKS